MLFIPLGLQSRIFKIPWGTVLLFFSVLLFSINKIWYQIQFENLTQIKLFFIESLSFETPLQLIMAIYLLLTFSSFVEMRMGTVAYLATYFLGSFISIFLKKWDGDSTAFVPLFSLCTLIGTYLIYFSKSYYKILILKLPKTKKVTVMPAWGFLIVSQVFFLVIHIYSQQKFPFISLLGYAVGILVGILWNEISFLNRGFLFPDEILMLMRAKKQTDPLNKVDHILECLRVNPTNPQATEYLFRSIAKSKIAPHFFTSEQKDVISALMSSIIKRQVKIDMNMTIYLFSLLPLNWNITDIGLTDIAEDDLDFMQDLLEHSEWRTALRLYDAYLASDNDDEARSIVMATIQSLLNELARNGLKPTDKEWLQEYVLYHGSGYATNLIKATFFVKEKTESGAA